MPIRSFFILICIEGEEIKAVPVFCFILMIDLSSEVQQSSMAYAIFLLHSDRQKKVFKLNGNYIKREKNVILLF